ncbi:MAG: prepilin-type N-terminal cleavage/methylation domain-containing protein [Candidatus Binatia bacterium]
MVNRKQPVKLQASTLSVARRTSHGGFTLIEVLVAMSIFTIAVLGLAVGATSVMRANQTSYFSTLATNLAQDKLEELKGMTVSALPPCSSYTDTGCSDTSSSSGLIFTRSWQIIANSPVTGVNRIDVKVDWTDYISQSLTVSSAVKQ